MYPPAFIHHFVYYMLCFPFLSSQKNGSERLDPHFNYENMYESPLPS
ncbi:hypothetical protein BSM4216_1902 [Bacillus smithii]|nr:hypothetical protein BSM4216_1902 [Bacillus smithii]